MGKYLKIKKAELVCKGSLDKIQIDMIGLYDEDGKYIKWLSMEESITFLRGAHIPYSDSLLDALESGPVDNNDLFGISI